MTKEIAWKLTEEKESLLWLNMMMNVKDTSKHLCIFKGEMKKEKKKGLWEQ